MMIKHGVSILDDFAVVKFNTSYDGVATSARSDAIQFYKSLGITEIHGIPLEEFFVDSDYAAEKTLAKIWAKALEEEKNK